MLAALGLAAGAAAHTTSTGLAVLTLSGSTLTYRLTLVLAELPAEPARLMAAAAAGDSTAAEGAVEMLNRSVRVRAGDTQCRRGRASVQGSRLGDSRIVLELALRCPFASTRLVIRDDWADVLGEHYRTVARMEGPGGGRELVFMSDAREVTVELGKTPSASGAGFLRLGIEHILTGYDHLLFLAALLVGGGTFWSLARVVTAFTLAHSITLALAVLQVVTLPDRFVEAAIAGSIVWVASENLFFRGAARRRWLASFLFGLVHGLGFASALRPLELSGLRLVRALLGFNLGVEAGQALVVVAALPFLTWVGTRPWQPRFTFGVSMMLALAGAAWLVERLLFT